MQLNCNYVKQVTKEGKGVACSCPCLVSGRAGRHLRVDCVIFQRASCGDGILVLPEERATRKQSARKQKLVEAGKCDYRRRQPTKKTCCRSVAQLTTALDEA